MSIKHLSPEQRKDAVEKGQLARKAAIKAGESLFHDFSSEDITKWKELHKKYGLRMPQRHIPNTETKYIRRLAKALSFDLALYLECCGCKSLRELVGLNSSYPAYAECGLALEWWEDKQ